MKEQLREITDKTLEKIKGISTGEELNDIRVKVLGKKGELTGLLQNMKNVPAEERPEIGRIVNEARERIEEAIKQADAEISEKVLAESIKKEKIDVTLRA